MQTWIRNLEEDDYVKDAEWLFNCDDFLIVRLPELEPGQRYKLGPAYRRGSKHRLAIVYTKTDNYRMIPDYIAGPVLEILNQLHRLQG